MTLAYFEFKGTSLLGGSIQIPLTLSHVNWLAVLVSAFAAFMIAGAWYQALFGQAWAKAQGWSPERIEEIKKSMNPAKFFGGMVISYLVLATILAVLITSFTDSGIVAGIVIAKAVWLATAAITFTHQLASGRHFNAWLIDVSCEFVYFIIMGAIIGAWR
jgi:hypothetical protein